MRPFAVLLACATAVAAQQTQPVLSLFSGELDPGLPNNGSLPNNSSAPKTDKINYVGSVVDLKDAKTTVAVKCAQGTKDDECDIGTAGFVITQGPNTVVYTLTSTNLNATATAVLDCSLAGTTKADCKNNYVLTIPTSASALLLAYNTSYVSVQSTKVLTGTQLAYAKVTITAGAEKLKNSAGTTGVKIGGLAIGAILAVVLVL